jgi:hypothetical protein
MTEVLSKFQPANLIFLAMGAGVVLLLMLMVAAHYWYEARESENATKLKLDMLDRGMSADEIKTVLEAKQSK